MKAVSRFSVAAMLLVAGLLIGLVSSPATAQQVVGEFVGINIHQGSIHQDGKQNIAPGLYDPVQNLVRNYHSMSWDVDLPTDTTNFPYDKWHWVNWSTDYNLWVNTGTQVNACITVSNFPNAMQWGADPGATAFVYGAAFAQAFGPTVGSGVVTSVQIGNEPGNQSGMSDALYKQVFQGMAEGIRSVDPALIIVTCNTQDAPSGDYHKSISLFSDITHLVDAYAVHSYPFLRHWPTYEKSYPEDTRMEYVTKVAQMRAWVQSHDPTAQSWITEFGYDASSKPQPGDFMDVTDTQQAQWLVRSYFAWLDVGLDRAYMYWYNDNDSYSLHACSGLTRNWNPKPSYYAQGHMLGTLEDYQFIGAIQKDAGNLYVFEFVHKNDATDVIWVFWSPTGSDRTATITLDNLPGVPMEAERMPLASGPAPTVSFTVLDADSIEIPLSESPTYLFMVDGLANMPPIVGAGPDQNVAVDTVSLTGSVSDDGNPDPPGEVLVAWSKLSGPGTVEFSNANALATTATLSQTGTYVLRLTGYDGEHVRTDELTVTYEVVPHLEYQAIYLGGDKYGWTFSLYSQDGLMQPYTVELAFQGIGGTIQQVTYNSAAIHTETMADAFDGAGGYSKALDTWACSPFGDNPFAGINPATGVPLTGFYEAANTFAMSCYTGPGSAYGDGVPVAYVVCDGKVGWFGTITRDGQEHQAMGVTDDPPSLPGDYNGDGSVSGADYVVWADTFGNDGSPGKEDMRADGNGDGLVSGADYVLWADNFGSSAGGMTVSQSVAPAVQIAPADEEAAPAVSDEPQTRAEKRAARIAERKQRRADRRAAQQ